MKKLFLLMVIGSLTFFQSCNSEGETYEGEWVSNDFSYDFDLECDCTTEQKNQLRQIADEGMKLKIKQISNATSVNFTKDHTFAGTMMGESLSGTYKATDDQLTLKPDGYPEETLDINKEGETTHFTYEMDKEDLDGISESVTHPEFGEVTVVFTHLKLVMVNADSTQ